MELKKPTLDILPRAEQELALMLEHDFTLTDKVLRLQITSKGCDGFIYSIGFTPPQTQDITLQVELGKNKLPLAIAYDPFSCFYMQQCQLDFVANYQQDQEGFIIKNLEQHNHQGKFWEVDPQLIPHHLEDQV